MADLHIERGPGFRLLTPVLSGVDRRLIIAEILFVVGWTMMWASSLHFIPSVPPPVWLGLMILGLLLATVFRRSNRIPSTSVVEENHG
jgi:hypothetical protein